MGLHGLGIHTGIHDPVTILSKKRVDGFYPGLQDSKSRHTLAGRKGEHGIFLARWRDVKVDYCL